MGHRLLRDAALGLALIVCVSGAMARGGGHAGGRSHASPGGSHAVRGHVTKSGKYVAPTRAKNPNGTKHDNYSSKGNVNPANGKAGTKDADKP